MTIWFKLDGFTQNCNGFFLTMELHSTASNIFQKTMHAMVHVEKHLIVLAKLCQSFTLLTSHVSAARGPQALLI